MWRSLLLVLGLRSSMLGWCWNEVMEKCGQEPMGAERFSETFHTSWNISKHFCEWARDRAARWPVARFFFINDFLLKLWNFNVHSVWVMRSFPFIDWWRVFTFLDMILTQDSMDMCVDCGFNVCSKPHSMEIMEWFDSRMRNDHHQIFIRYYKLGLQGKE